MAYADVSDIEVRLQRTLSPSESACAESLIEGASAVLDKLVNVNEDDDEQAQLLNFVCTNMVCRAFSTIGYDGLGASQTSMTAGAYTQSFSFSTPMGDMYLTKLEKRLLGITSCYVDSIQGKIHGFFGANDD